MGRLRTLGRTLLTSREHLTNTDRVGMILGTGWSEPAVLADQGFVLEEEVPFNEVWIEPFGEGAGHPNRFLLGTWHGIKVVISQGRMHRYQEWPDDRLSVIYKWMSILLTMMGNGSRIVITCSAGGVSDRAKTGVLMQPTGLVSAHLASRFLPTFMGGEELLWTDHEESGTKRPLTRLVFEEAAKAADLHAEFDGTHILVPGRGFGGAAERRIWKTQLIDSVGMSMGPEVRLCAIENMDNTADDAPDDAPDLIEVLAALVITDDHDLPKHAEIQAAALERAPQLGAFLDHVIDSTWITSDVTQRP